MIKPKIPVAKEGYPFIGYAAFITLICALLGYPAVVLVMVAVTTFILMFFRDPERFVPEDEDALISPADGKIIVARKVQDDTFTGGEAFKLSIFMNVFNVHVNRMPADATVKKIDYFPGKFFNA